MSKLELVLSQESYKPGDKVEGNILLSIDKETKVRDIVIEVYGEEYTHITRTHGSGKNKRTVTHTEHVEIIDESQSLLGQFDKTFQLDPYAKGKNTILPVGQHCFKFSFQLPNDAAPTYDGSNAEVSYEIYAKADRPWRFDLKAEDNIRVIPADAKETTTQSTTLEEKSGGKIMPQALSPDIKMSVQLNKTAYKRGETIEGKLIVNNNSGKSIRNILLSLYANEHAEAGGYTEDSTVMETSEKVPVTYSDLNYFEQTFKIQVPNDIIPTMSKKYFNINWYLNIGLDVAKASDLETETDLIIT